MVRIWGKESYEKAMILPKKVRGYVDLIRPFTLLAPLIGGLCGGLMGWVSLPENAGLHLPFIYINHKFPFLQYHDGFLELLIGASTLAILNAASNALNGVYDADIDKINKPYRPIPAGVITREEGRAVAWILYLIVLARAFLMQSPYRIFFILVFIIALITVAYSVPPIRLKKRLWVSNITIAFARGMLGFVAAWSIFGNPFSEATPWIIGGVMMIFLIGAITSKDFTDIRGDRVYKIRTLPVVYGVHRSAMVSGPFFVMPFVLILVSLMAGLLKIEMFWLVLLAVWGVITALMMQSVSTREEKTFENSIVWVNMYLLLIAMQVFFAATYVFNFEILG